MAEKPDDSYVATMRQAGKDAILVITADGTQDLEFFYPYYRFIEAGYRVDVATPDGGAFKGKMGMGLTHTLALEAVQPERYALLYIPGGKAPAKLMRNIHAINITRHFVAGARPVAAICHGAQVLAAADVVKGKRIAAWPEVQNEVETAGGLFVNEPTVVDLPFITARWPGDLPSHLKAIFTALGKSGSHHSDTKAA